MAKLLVTNRQALGGHLRLQTQLSFPGVGQAGRQKDSERHIVTAVMVRRLDLQ